MEKKTIKKGIGKIPFIIKNSRKEVSSLITSISQLYFFEKSENDSFRVKKLYVDIADDLVAGILLGQIIYWFLPDKSGNNKLKIEREGKLWLAKKREDWFEEIRITPKQFDRAISILKAKGLVEVKNFKFNGAPTIHIHLNEDKLLEEINKFYREYQTNVCNENGNSSEGKMDFSQTSKSSSNNDFETHEKQEMEAEQENNWDNASKPLGDMDFTQRGKWILPKGENLQLIILITTYKDYIQRLIVCVIIAHQTKKQRKILTTWI